MLTTVLSGGGQGAPPARSGDEGAWPAALSLSTVAVWVPLSILCVAAGPGDSRRPPQVDRGLASRACRLRQADSSPSSGELVSESDAGSCAYGGVGEEWPVASDSADAMVLSGPEGARLVITPRLDSSGALAEVAWRGRAANGAQILGHGGAVVAVAAAAAWAAGLDQVPAITAAELAARRAATGASQADLARMMGVGQGVVSQWESGRRAPRDPAAVLAAVEALEALAEDLRRRAVATGAATGRILTWDTIDDYRAACPQETGRGASPAMLRVATARAWHDLRAQGTHARIISGCEEMSS